MLNQRAEPRYDVHWPVRLGHRRYGSVSGRTLNVGLSGALFLTHERYEVGDQIEMQLWIRSAVCIQCVCRIVRLHAVLADEYAIAACFLRIAEDGRTQLSERLLEVRREEWGTKAAGGPLPVHAN
jgi:hypothetical protein